MAIPPASTDQAAGQAADPTPEPDRLAVGEGTWSALAAWAADELGVRLAFDGKLYRIEDAEPDEANGAEPNRRRSWFRRRAPKADANEGEQPAPEPFTTEAPADVLLELIDRLRERPSPPFARPIEQPTAVHDFSAQLFEAYTLDNGGQAHLAGCHLEDVPLVRLTTVHDEGGASASVSHRYFDELGMPIEAAQVAALGIDRLAPIVEPRPRLDMGRLERMLESARRGVGEETALATIVWAKHATGRLRFEFGDESVDLEFDGWARTLEAPPIECPQTGVETFHLAADDEGVIAAAEAIVPSVVTGRRRLASELTKCAATGGLAEAEHFGVSAATGEAVLKSELVTCGRCGLAIAPAEQRPGDCAACRQAKRIDLAGERWNAIVVAHPGLVGPKWRTTEIAGAYLLESNGWLRRRFVTLDRDTLAVKHVAEAGRFASAWRSLPKTTYD